MSAEKSIRDVFASYQEAINSEQDLRERIRETVKEIERNMKGILSDLQKIHSQSSDNLTDITAECRVKLNDTIKPLLAELNSRVPHGEYYRFNDIWRFHTSKLSFIVALIHYLETDLVAEREFTAEVLGLATSPEEKNIFLDLDDYLQGLLQMAAELSRFTVNCVTKGDVKRPRKIFKTMSDLQQGFSELNLKNDHLRRMFDSLKYDIKRVEQVIYDLTIRGIDVAEPTADSTDAAGTTTTTTQ